MTKEKLISRLLQPICLSVEADLHQLASRRTRRRVAAMLSLVKFASGGIFRLSQKQKKCQNPCYIWLTPFFGIKNTDGSRILHTLLVKHYNDLLDRQSSEWGRDEVTYFDVGDVFGIYLGPMYANFQEKNLRGDFWVKLPNFSLQ